jgi:hypothetical protein
MRYTYRSILVGTRQCRVPTVFHNSGNCCINYPSGVHVLAILKDSQHSEVVEDDYLLEDWLQVRSQINSDAVHLWRGK